MYLEHAVPHKICHRTRSTQIRVSLVHVRRQEEEAHMPPLQLLGLHGNAGKNATANANTGLGGSDGKRDGYFTVIYANGDKYVGEYRVDKKNGQGTFTFANGRIKEGIWKGGKFLYPKKVILQNLDQK